MTNEAKRSEESGSTVGLGVKDNKVQMHVDLNRAYTVLLDLTHKLDLKAFNADLRDGRSFLSRMVDLSDYPPC